MNGHVNIKWIVFKKYYAVTSDPIRMKLYVKSEPLLQI